MLGPVIFDVGDPGHQRSLSPDPLGRDKPGQGEEKLYGRLGYFVHYLSRHYSGSQEKAAPERSSGMNEGLSAGKACSAIASGVQPVALCRLRIGRGELNR